MTKNHPCERGAKKPRVSCQESAGEAEVSSLPRLLVFLDMVDSRENWKLLNVNNLKSKVDSRENKISHKKVCMTCSVSTLFRGFPS